VALPGKLMTLAEAAECSACSPKTVRRAIDAGQFVAVRPEHAARLPPPQTGGATAGLSSIAPNTPPHLGQKAQLDVTEDR